MHFEQTGSGGSGDKVGSGIGGTAGAMAEVRGGAAAGARGSEDRGGDD